MKSDHQGYIIIHFSVSVPPLSSFLRQTMIIIPPQPLTQLTGGSRTGGHVGRGVVVVVGGVVVLVINNPNSANRFMWKSFCDSTGGRKGNTQ